MQYLNIYSADFFELPEALSRLTNLVDLLADRMFLQCLPPFLTALSKLEHLTLARQYDW